MPRGRQAFKEMLHWWKEHPEAAIGEDEPWHLARPRKDAQKRIKNEAKQKYVRFKVSETDFSEWHAQDERYKQCAKENPTLARSLMLRALQVYPVENLVQEESHDSQ